MIPVGEINSDKNLNLILSVQSSEMEENIGSFSTSVRDLIDCSPGKTDISTKSYNFYHDSENKIKTAKISFGIKFKFNDESDINKHLS